MSSHKPKFQSRKSKTTLDEFAEGAETSKTYHANEEGETGGEEQNMQYPWEDLDPHEKKHIALYLTKPYAAKLKYISEKTGIPQNVLMREALIPMIDQKLKDLE
jgi:hypothetical protein